MACAGTGLLALDADLLERIVRRLRQHEPQTIAVLVTGSYANGRATPSSDLDLTAITRRRPRVHYRIWFEDRRDGPPLHVSAGAATPADWKRIASEPANWSFGLAARDAARYLFATPKALAMLGEDPSCIHPAALPEVEDLLEATLKTRRALHQADERAVRLFAQIAASHAPRCLAQINPPQVVENPREALDAVLALPVAPPHFAQNLLVCLGLEQAAATQVADAALQLAEELFAFLRERAQCIDPQPDIARYLADGTLERALRSAEQAP